MSIDFAKFNGKIFILRDFCNFRTFFAKYIVQTPSTILGATCAARLKPAPTGH